MASLAAVASQRQQDEVMSFPLLRAVGTYLNIEVLMPPERLRWSRLLGRPMLSQIVTMTNDGWGDDLGPVFI